MGDGPEGGSGALAAATIVIVFVLFVIAATMGWLDQLYVWVF